MLELHIANTNLTDSNVSVGWCLDKETLQTLARRGWNNPVIVFMTAPFGKGIYKKEKEYRKVVSLKDHIAYLEFRSHGPNKIWAFLAPSEKIAKDTFMLPTRNHYYIPIVNSSGEEYTDVGFLIWELSSNLKTEEMESFMATPLDVIVPEGVFAEEPAKWEKAWVNWILKGGSIDQCSFRKKRVFAYSLQPILYILNIFPKIILFTFAFLIGMIGCKNIGCLTRLSIFSEDCYTLFNEGCWAIKPVEGKFLKNISFNIARVIFTLPVSLLLIFLIIKFASVAHFIKPLLVAIGCLAVGVGIFLGIGITYDFLKDKKSNKPAWFLNEEEQGLIICSPDKKITSLNDLPFNKKTIWLRFQDVKAKICRPYSA